MRRPGARLHAGSPGYFSVDAGTTSLGTFNTVSGGDAGDWASSTGTDSFDAFTPSGVINPVTGNDLRAIQGLGLEPRAGVAVRGRRCAGGRSGGDRRRRAMPPSPR